MQFNDHESTVNKTKSEFRQLDVDVTVNNRKILCLCVVKITRNYQKSVCQKLIVSENAG